METGKGIRKVKFEETVRSVTLSPDGRRMAARSYGKTAWMIEVDTGKEIRKLRFLEPLTSLSFSSDGRRGCGIGRGQDCSRD